MRQGNRFTLSGLVAFMSLLAASAATRSDTQPVVGHVLDLDGDWHAYASDTSNSQSQQLTKWQELHAGDVVRVRSPLSADYITIVDQRLEVLVERSCRVANKCSQPIYLPKSAEAAGTDAYASALRQVWNLLSGGAYELSMHRVRMLTPLRLAEGIAPIRNGQVDLRETMRDMSRGTYFLSPCNQEAGCEEAANRNMRDGVTFDWNPDLPTPVTVGNRRPGLYEASGANSDHGALEPDVSVRVLICPSPSSVAAMAAFRSAQTSANKWTDVAASETTHSFLRAYLTQLARSGVCTGQ